MNTCGRSRCSSCIEEVFEHSRDMCPSRLRDFPTRLPFEIFHKYPNSPLKRQLYQCSSQWKPQYENGFNQSATQNKSVIAPLEASLTRGAYFASAPLVTNGLTGFHNLRLASSSSSLISGIINVFATASIEVTSPFRMTIIGPPTAASGAM